jgi:hypothetical protein
MIKRFSFLLLKGDIYANPFTYFLQCTDMNIQYTPQNYLKLARYYSTRLSLIG